jgi:hypothetical protein
MIAIHGPSNRTKRTPSGIGEIFLLTHDPLMVDAETLGSALAAYSREYRVEIRPYDGSDPQIPFRPGELPKYFFYEKSDGGGWLVDIHIVRGTETICPKQDLGVRLQSGDRVHIGELAC